MLVSLVVPWIFSMGSVTLPTYRLVLAVLTIPAIAWWLSGKAGRVRLADVLVIAFCAWCILSFVVVQGAAATIQPAGMLIVETCGAYFLARTCVRSAGDFYRVAKLLFWIVMFLMPFALAETVSGHNFLLELSRMILPGQEDHGMPPRAGLWRVQGPFDHPILFGVFCGASIGVVYLVFARKRALPIRIAMAGMMMLTASLSLSSGPITAVVAQMLLLGWNWLLRANPLRWRILWILLALAYLAIDLASNQSVMEFFISHFAFDKQTAYFRLIIWHYGTGSVAAYPWFGVGFGEWLRPDWMPYSIDMFWLLWAIRNGLPAAILMFCAFLAATLRVAFTRGLDDLHQLYRTAYLISMTGLFLVGWTVHFWNATSVLFMFLLGSGMWLIDAGEAERKLGATQEDRAERQAWRPRPTRAGV